MNIKPRPATSPRHALRRGLVQGVTCFALFAAPLVGASMLPMTTTWEASPGHSQTQVSAAERMVEQGQCWTGDTPADVEVPGHVWVNGTYRGERGVAAAFEQLVFDGVLPANEWTQPVDHGLTVNAFCR